MLPPQLRCPLPLGDFPYPDTLVSLCLVGFARSLRSIISCKAETQNKLLAEIKAFLDCGAFYNFITRSLAQHLHLNIVPLKKGKETHGY